MLFNNLEKFISRLNWQASLTMFASAGVIGAEIAQWSLLWAQERDPSKVEATSSNLVFRSTRKRRFSFEKVHGVARESFRLQ